MRVLQVGSNVVNSMGGMALAIRDARRALGGDIVSFTSPELLKEGTADVLHIAQSATPAGRLYGWAGADARAREAFDRCDVVLIHGLFRHHYSWACRLARKHARPYLIFPHGGLDPVVFTYRTWQKKAWWRLVGQPGLNNAAGAVFITARERDKAATRAQLPALRHVVPLPVDAPPAGDTTALRHDARARLGIGAAHRVLLFLGRLDPIKRLPAIIGAFNRAARPDLHLIVAGPDGPEINSDDCARLVAPAARGRVHLTGAAYGVDKRALHAAADAFVSVSTRENFGYALCEALAAGLPAIVGPGTDLGAELDEAGCVWRLERDDEESVARAYVNFAQAPQAALQDMGRRGRDWVGQRLSFRTFRESLLRICTQARS